MRLFSALSALASTLLAPAVLAAQTLPAAGTAAQRLIVVYRAGVIPPAAEAATHAVGGLLVHRHERLGMVSVAVAEGAGSAVRARLQAQPGVEMVLEDRVLTAHALTVRAAAPAADSSADALYHSPQGWAVRAAGGFAGTGNQAPGAWNATTGKGQRIAILDSGVDALHPDIAPNLALNLSEVDQNETTGLPSPCDDGSPADQQGHGTWSASLAAGALGAGTGLVAGMAPSATLLNIKVLERMPAIAGDASSCAQGQAAGLLSWVIQGIDDAVANHADVISMSLGTLVDITTGDGAGTRAVFDRATHAAAAAGVVLVAAAGNDGLDLGSAQNQRFVELPAQSRDVLAIVASTNAECAEDLAAGAACRAGSVTRPYYSNYGANLNALAAPGGSYPASTVDGSTDAAGVTGWVTGACSDGAPTTADGLPSQPGHSFGCFGLGHRQYVQAMGTSASAPLVAGAAALVRAAHPEWQPAQVVEALRNSAVRTPGLDVPQVNVAALLTGAGAPQTHFVLAPLQER